MSPPFWGSANLSTGRLHFFRKFALGRQIPRYDLEVRRVFPQFFADHIVRVENERLPLGDMANEAKRRGKIGIAADDNVAIGKALLCIRHHRNGQIYIGALLFGLYDLRLFMASLARLPGKGKPNATILIEPLDDLDALLRGLRLKINVLSKNRRRIASVGENPRGEISNKRHIVVGLEQCL